MANRPKGYGLTAELKNKIAAKYEVEKEQEARIWMEEVVGEPIDPESRDSDEPLGPDRFYEVLRDGVYLCKLISRLVAPDKVKINTMKVPFKQMENIQTFLLMAEKYGVAKSDLFQTVDLYENQNLWAVVTCLHALGRKAQKNGYKGRPLGPKEAKRNPRNFSPDKLRGGHAVIGLQMGSNKGASQAGMSFGDSRQILAKPNGT